MSASVTQDASLFPYLVAEEQHRDHQAMEALLLTFNVDLGYFEARLLGLLRATGARISVIADAQVWSPDTRAVKHAGRSYHLGLVDRSSAFHPKLTVIVGPKRAVAAVGSGNLTMGGWQYNRELLTVFTGDVDGMPRAFRDIRNALSTLVASGALDSISAQGVERTVIGIDTLLNSAPPVETGHHVHASWDSALIEQLPTEPIAELHLSAAFHDHKSNAVRRLLTRMQPRRVQVAVQPGWTHLIPTTLDRVLTEYATRTGGDAALLQDPESLGSNAPRYRHGKLIEWVTAAGVRHAMTGSPNLSTAALLKRPLDGGNYELAVTGPLTTSLFPGGDPVDPAAIPDLLSDDKSDRSELTAQSIRVLSAVTRDDRLIVHLSGIPDRDVTVEVSNRNDHPDQWNAIGAIARNEAATAVFDTSVTAGSRVRASTIEGGATAPMFVTDERRVLMRSLPERHTSKTRSSNARDLFADDLELLDLLQGELTEFARDVSNSRLPTASRESEVDRATVDRQRDTDPIEPWLWLQDDTVRRYGPSLASWLLALPRLTNTESSTVPWIDILTDEQAVGLDSDEEATDADESLTSPEVEANTSDLIDHTTDREQIKAARRRWAVQAAAVAPSVTVPSRLLILRITLAFWTGGNWSEFDIQPFVLVRDLVRTLNSDDQPRELKERTASLAAIAITLMRQHTPDVTVGTEHTVLYHQARDAALPLLSNATEETIDSYVTGLRTAYGGTLASGHVTDTLEDLLGGDPLAELEAAMELKGFDIHRPTPTSMHIHKSRGNPELTALEAVAFAQDHDGVVVWATTNHGRTACIAWRAPDLVSVVGPPELWRHQRLRSGGPAAAARALRNTILSNEAPSSLPGLVSKNRLKTAAAEAVIASLGVRSPQEPPCCYNTDSEADRPNDRD